MGEGFCRVCVRGVCRGVCKGCKGPREYGKRKRPFTSVNDHAVDLVHRTITITITDSDSDSDVE